MSNVISILTRQPLTTHDEGMRITKKMNKTWLCQNSNATSVRITSASKRTYFEKGDTFTTSDGVKVLVMDERITPAGKELLMAAHGIKRWIMANRFWRVS